MHIYDPGPQNQSQGSFFEMYTSKLKAEKISFDLFAVGNLQNIFMEHDLYLIS